MASGAMIVETTVGIARSPQDVFDVLADPSTWSALDAALVDVEPCEAVVPGATGTIRRRVGLGLTVTTAWENTEFVPGVRLENLIKGFGYELRETVRLAADAHGTQVTVVDTLMPTSLVGRAMVAMSRGITRRGARYAISRDPDYTAVGSGTPATRRYAARFRTTDQMEGSGPGHRLHGGYVAVR